MLRRRWEYNIESDLTKIMRMGDGWNWLRIVPSGGLWY
jgi:hypothetical protein